MSKRWNSVMQTNLLTCKKNKIKFIWIKHLTSNSSSFKFTLKNNRDLTILEVSTDKTINHAEAFLFESLKYLGLKKWYLRIDSDELISLKYLKLIQNSIPYLDSGTVYKFKRLWIKKIGKNYCYSSISVSSNGDPDYQPRLFFPDRYEEDLGIHTVGIKYKKSRLLDSNISILHLIWELENVNKRLTKIKKYNEISPGGGSSNLRYYLPEIFSNHNWITLLNDDQNILEIWSNVTKNKDNRIKY